MGEAYSGKTGSISWGGPAGVIKISEWTLSRQSDLNECTNMTSAGVEEFVAGIERYTLDCTAYADTDNTLNTNWDSYYGQNVLIVLGDGDTTFTVTDLTGSVSSDPKLTSMNISCTVDGNTVVTFTFECSVS